MRCLGWEVVLLGSAARFRRSGQNIDVRGPGHAAVERMGLLDAVKANTTEQDGTFVTAETRSSPGSTGTPAARMARPGN